MQKTISQVPLLLQDDNANPEWEQDLYTRADILNVVCSLFCEQGYRGTTMRDIAKALGLKESSLYNHMKSKEEVLWAIVNRLTNLFLAQASFVPQDLPCDEQLAQLMRGHLDVIIHERYAATVFFREWQILSSAFYKQIQEKLAAYEDYFYRVLVAGKQQGIFQFSDAHLALLFLLSSLNAVHQWLAWAEPKLAACLKEQYEQFLLRALKET